MLVCVAGCGGKGRIGGQSAPTNSTTSAAGTTISDVQTASGNWQSCGQIGPKYLDCAAPCSESTWKEVYGVSSPSKNGDATQFELSPKLPGADVLFTAGLIGTNSTQTPDASHTLLPTLHHFTYSADFYVTNTTVTKALEFDISLFMDALRE